MNGTKCNRMHVQGNCKAAKRRRTLELMRLEHAMLAASARARLQVFKGRELLAHYAASEAAHYAFELNPELKGTSQW